MGLKLVVLKIFRATFATVTLASAQVSPLGPGGMLRPWNWPTVIPAVAVPEEENPKLAAPVATPPPGWQPTAAVTVPPPTTTAQVRSERLISRNDGSFAMATVWVKGSLAVYRNGLRQMPGLDYVEERDSKRIVPLVSFSPTDLVLVDYEKLGY